MRTLEPRTELDEFELADNYDFSAGIRGRFYQSTKVTTTIELDNETLLFIKKRAIEKHIDYQTLLNSVLRDYMQGNTLDRSQRAWGALSASVGVVTPLLRLNHP